MFRRERIWAGIPEKKPRGYVDFWGHPGWEEAFSSLSGASGWVT
jgi:hypothetical protein